MSFLQKSFTPSFRRKPESRIARKSWIPGRASLARNDDFRLLSRVLQEAHILPKSPLTPLFQIPRYAGLPFVKGGKEGFTLRCLYNYGLTNELLATVTYSVIPAKAGIQNCLKTLDSGSRFACPE